MTAKTKALVSKVISEASKPFGFRRQGTNWLRQDADALLGINLQSSRYSRNTVYINFFVWYPSLVDRPYGSYARGDFHIGFRFTDIDVNRDNIVRELLDVDGAEVDAGEFARRLREACLDDGLVTLASLAKLPDPSRILALNETPLILAEELRARASNRGAS